MSSQSPVNDLSNLIPDIFNIIADHVPLVERPSTLLSLALTSQRLREIVIPDLLYRQITLTGEEATIPFLRNLTAELSQAEPRSHHIHHLSIDSEIFTPTKNDDSSLRYLHDLINAGGLPNLVSLTLRVSSEWENEQPDVENYIDAFYVHPSSFWDALQEKCPKLREIQMTDVWQENSDKNQWIQKRVLPKPNLTSLRLEGNWYDDEASSDVVPLDFSQAASSLQTLEFRMKELAASFSADACSPGGLLASTHFANLQTLILDAFAVTDPTLTRHFWKSVSGLTRLELYDSSFADNAWFEDFDSDMLPNLQYLTCDFISARALLPHVSQRLISLHITNSYNTQAVYLLRAVVKSGELPLLRSLGIHRTSQSSSQSTEGHRWQEDANGTVTEANPNRPSRGYDANYIRSVSKAAPNLEELQLMGTCDEKMDLDGLTISLSLLPKLRRLLLSGSVWQYNWPFFHSSYNWPDYEAHGAAKIDASELDKLGYAPESFDEAARDLAEGCRTLEEVTMTNRIGEFYVRQGKRLSARIVRESVGGPVKDVRRIRAWGPKVGRESWW